MEANKKEILGLITEMHQKINDRYHPSTTIVTTQQTTTQTEPPTTTVLSACPVGWEMFQHTCYLYAKTDLVNWETANSRCADQGGILAEPDTSEKFRFLQSKFQGYTTGYYYNIWIGATDNQTKGTWLWISSGKPIDPSLWTPGHPVNLRGYDWDCLGMDYQRRGWRDIGCDYSWNQPYICERPARV